MANVGFNRVQAREKEIKLVHLKVTTDGASDVTAIDSLGVASVEQTAADTYTITLKDAYVEFRGASVTPGVTSGHSVSNVDVKSAKTLEVNFGASQASTEFYVTLHLKNTSAI